MDPEWARLCSTAPPPRSPGSSQCRRLTVKIDERAHSSTSEARARASLRRAKPRSPPLRTFVRTVGAGVSHSQAHPRAAPVPHASTRPAAPAPSPASARVRPWARHGPGAPAPPLAEAAAAHATTDTTRRRRKTKRKIFVPGNV
ncbi:hypothetical protein HDU84_003305 [Entophlyctis sp. JEL0112]|nr:hypothetical protein HDU84_003305 [Entophlyctis sp. JEL0112]